jgi:hypothetical protein
MASTEITELGAAERASVETESDARSVTASDVVADSICATSSVVGARFPIRLLRPAAWRLRAPHRVAAGAARRGPIEAI